MPEPALGTVIAGYARTAFHPARKGQLVGVRPDQLAAAPLRHLIEQSAIDPAQIEDVIMGCAFPEAEQGFNIGRLAVFYGGFAGVNSRDDGEPLLWVFHAVSTYCSGGDSTWVRPCFSGGWCREHEPGAD